MGLQVDDGLVETLYMHSGAAGVLVKAPPDQLAKVRAALVRLEARQLEEILFRDAPEEGPFSSYASGVEEKAGGRAVWFDMADAEAYREHRIMETLVAILLEELERAGVAECIVSPYPW